MINRDEAIEIARNRALEKEWAFAEPLKVDTRKSWRGKITRYEIETNAANRGSKACFVIDASSGKILKEGYISR